MSDILVQVMSPSPSFLPLTFDLELFIFFNFFPQKISSGVSNLINKTLDEATALFPSYDATE